MSLDLRRSRARHATHTTHTLTVLTASPGIISLSNCDSIIAAQIVRHQVYTQNGDRETEAHGTRVCSRTRLGR